jgi:hypothetical protein
MSLKIIKSQVEKFLISKTPEVMVIKGKWGVGKTYSWKNFLLDAKRQRQIGLEHYSYVSLFGINSLESFKFAVFENLVDKKNIPDETNYGNKKGKTSSINISKWREGFRSIKGMPFFNSYLPANLEALLFSTVNDSLICIDDLERAGTTLEIKEVLGLITVLKEQKGCKVLLLLNDKEEGLKDYYKYKEKVVDLELRFDLTPEESANIAFKKPGNEFEIAKERTQELKIINIRALKKVEYFIERLIPLLKGYEEEVTNHAIHSLTLFTWCYYCSNDGAPPFKFVTKLSYSSYLGLDKNKELDDKSSKWMAILRKYSYTSFDDFDRVFAEFVQTGFLNEKDFIREASAKNEKLISEKGKTSFFDSWQVYHNNFNDNEEEVINSIYNSFKENILTVSRLDLNGAVTIFRELGQDQKVSEMIDLYIESRKDEENIFSLSEGLFPADKIDEEIVEKFNSASAKSIPVENASQVLERLSRTNSWNNSDVAILVGTTVQEYRQLFKSESGDHLASYVDRCLEFGRYGNDKNKEYLEIARRARAALIEIGSESNLNKLRVKKFGVKITD